MKVKIIKNYPIGNGNASDISEFIGQVFNARLEDDGSVSIEDNGELFLLTIFEGEYEVVEL